MTLRKELFLVIKMCMIIINWAYSICVKITMFIISLGSLLFISQQYPNLDLSYVLLIINIMLITGLINTVRNFLYDLEDFKRGK